MKKLLLISAAALIASGAFAQDPSDVHLSVGAGIYLPSDFGGGVEAVKYDELQILKTPYYGGGFFAFFDATYIEFSVGLFGAGGTMESITGYRTADYTVHFITEADYSVMGLDIGFLVKWPFAVHQKIVLFPLMGMVYRVMLSAELQDGDKNDSPVDLSAIWVRAGGGLYASFTPHIFMYASTSYGIRLENKEEKDEISDAKYHGWNAYSLLGHGLELKIGLGYTF